jgi:hypothetical protein
VVDKRDLHHYTGMTVADVELVYGASKEKLLAIAAQQHHPNANTPTLTSHNLLAITLHWLRRKPTYDELSHLYPHGVHFWHSTLRKVVAALDECIFPRFVPALAPNAPTAVRFPHVKIIVDTTFVPLPKTPFTPADYHKKSPTKAAWKYEIACDFSHRIISCSRGYHGGQHDMRIIRESGLLNQSSPTALIMGDKGYRGQLGIVVPASKKAKVSKEVKELEDEKQRGHELQAERAAVECINKRVKEWAVARTVWEGTREPEEFFDSVMRVVCALTNVILCTHPLWASDHRRADGRSVS